MTISRPLSLILVAAMCGGIAHAGEFSLGSAQMLAQNTVQAGVDVTVNFTERNRAMRETSEGGDTAVRDVRAMRGADVTTPNAVPNAPAAAKPAAVAPQAADAPHGISISPAAAVRRPSYRWQSLVPGTIK